MSAYRFALQFNGSYAFRSAPRASGYQRPDQDMIGDLSGPPTPGARRCKACGHLLAKWDEPLDGLVIKKRQYDISTTYDGVVVVSERFASLWKRHAFHGLSFHPLPDDPTFAAIHAMRSVRFDAERRGVRFGKKCNVCGHYDSVLGPIPVILKRGSRISEKECVQTDVEFGSGDQMNPKLLCGELAAQTLAAAKLKGLCLVDIENDSLENPRILKP